MEKEQGLTIQQKLYIWENGDKEKDMVRAF